MFMLLNVRYLFSCLSELPLPPYKRTYIFLFRLVMCTVKKPLSLGPCS